MGSAEWIFPLFLVVVVGAIGISFYGSLQATKAARAFAEERGWTFVGTSRSLPREFPSVAPFGIGSSRSARQAMRYHVRGREGYTFTYTYTTGSGDDKTTVYHHVVSLQLPLPLPQLVLRRETLTVRMGKKFGMPDVQFESEEFNRAWLVQSEHLPAAHDVIHPRMMEWLLARGPANVVIEDDVLFVWTTGAQKLENIEPQIAYLMDFEAQIPEYVWHKARGEYPRPERR